MFLRAFVTAFLSLFSLIGVYCVVVSLWASVMADQSATWPSVPGRFLDARGVHAGRSTITIYSYQYTVNGVTYTNDREYFGLTTGHCAPHLGADQVRFGEGLPVDVFYSPENPSLSALCPGPVASLGQGIFVGLVFFGFGVGGYFAARSDFRKRGIW